MRSGQRGPPARAERAKRLPERFMFPSNLKSDSHDALAQASDALRKTLALLFAVLTAPRSPRTSTTIRPPPAPIMFSAA